MGCDACWPHSRGPCLRQDADGSDREARLARGEGEWGLFEASVVLLAVSAPLLVFGLLWDASAFVPWLGPTCRVRDRPARRSR